jgi:hypothetical protein
MTLLAVIGASQCWGASVLVFEDGTLGTSVVAGAVALAGQTEVVAPDQATFNTLLAEGGWLAVIFAEQNESIFDASASYLTDWIAGGGVLIGQTWLDGGLDTLLGGSQASVNGDTITTDGSPIFTGLGSTITLASPGWGVFSQGYSALAGGTCLGTISGGSGGGCAVIQANGGLTFLNAGLTDTYASVADGQQLLANEITLASSSTSTPEPSSLFLMGGGLLGLAGFTRRKLRK